MKRYRFGLDGMCREDAMGSYVLYSDAHALELALAAERTRSEAMKEALEMLYQETKDYTMLNRLGDPHQNLSMQLARKVLENPK